MLCNFLHCSHLLFLYYYRYTLFVVRIYVVVVWYLFNASSDGILPVRAGSSYWNMQVHYCFYPDSLIILIFHRFDIIV